MYKHMIESASEQFKSISLFECCYVRGNRATYAVHDSDLGSFQNPLFYRTVDILTGQVLDEGLHFNENVKKEHVHSFSEALKNHYNPEYIQGDALSLMYEQLRLSDADKSHMHYHTVFGQSVFYQDVDELHVTETGTGKGFCIFSDGVSEA